MEGANKEYHNILIVKLSSLGDVIHALPCLKALRDIYPKARLSWIVEPAFAGFLPGEPYLDEIILFDKAQLKQAKITAKLAFLRKLGAALKQRKFDLVLDLQAIAKSALVAWLTGCPNRLGYCDMRELSWLVSKPTCGQYRHAHVIERYLDVVRALGAVSEEVVFPLPDLGLERERMTKLLGEFGLVPDCRPVIIAPGTRWPTKHWPVENFTQLARRLADDGLKIVVVGGAEDREFGRQIAGQNPDIIDVTGRTTLKELLALLSFGRLFVGADTGPMHMAVAVGTPVVALFGPHDFQRNGPYRGDNIVITSNKPCSPCFKKTCDHWTCMPDIEVNKVYDTCRKMLKKVSKNDVQALGSAEH